MYAAILCANPQGLQVIFESVITWTRTLNGPLTKVCLLIKVIVCMYCTNCCLLLCFYHDYLRRGLIKKPMFALYFLIFFFLWYILKEEVLPLIK